MRRALIAALALAALGAAPAHAATVLGAPGPTGIIGSANGAAVQRTSSDVSYTVPAGGVITSWWFTTGTQSGSMRLLVFRPTGVSSQYTVVGRSDLGNVPTADTASPHFATRIAVQAGDLLGAKSQGPRSTYPAGDGTDMVCDGASGWTDPALGAMLTTSSCSGGTRINIAAAVEPDADGDGYGDETQDACPSDATTAGACPIAAPPPVITTPPVTTTNPSPSPTPTPTLSALAAAPATFRLGAKTTLSFKLDMAAKVTVSFLRRSVGRRSGRRCVAPTRVNRRARACVREREVGKLSVDGTAGLNRVRFTGRLSARRTLAAGSYRVVAVANASGKLSTPRSVVVRIVKA